MPTTQIYIRKESWEQFNAEEKKSDLINQLLENHYKATPYDAMPKVADYNNPKSKALDIPGVVKGSDFVPKEKDPFKQFLKDYSQPGTRPPHPECGYPCCHKASPCRHWAYNEVESHWVNELTKETKDA